MRRKMAAGNWKMNGLNAALAEVSALGNLHPNPACDIVICPPATLVAAMVNASAAIQVGGQDCHVENKGAYTGDISAEMLQDAGATHVIVGHSERRDGYGETNERVNTKAQNGWAAGLTTIICCGESESQRDSGETLAHIDSQLAGSIPDGATGDNTVIAYEPIWAIGTGRTPTLEDIAQVHDSIRKSLTGRFGAEGDKMRILYGGSMNPGNVDDIRTVSNVDGGLVGGASLKAADFTKIVTALEK